MRAKSIYVLVCEIFFVTLSTYAFKIVSFLRMISRMENQKKLVKTEDEGIEIKPLTSIFCPDYSRLGFC